MRKLLWLYFFFILPLLCPAEIIYVDRDAIGANDGSNWINAYNFLQDALADANSSPKPVEIRVAKGTYTPDTNSLYPNGTGDRYASFDMITSVSIKGGYAGNSDSDPNARDFQLYETILSGDLDGNDIDVNDPCDLMFHPTRLDNSYHVVKAQDVNDTIIDGFSITSGNADYFNCENWTCGFKGEGGGIFVYATGQVSRTVVKFCTPTVINCNFFKNSSAFGAGICNKNGDLSVNNCNFYLNFSLRSGAGISSIGGKSYIKDNQEIYLVGLHVSDCRFYQNHASRAGSGICNDKSDSIITECEFFDNESDYQGGAMANFCSGVIVTGCIFSNNFSSYSGGGITNYMSCCEFQLYPNFTCSHCIGSSSKFINCIFYGNITEGNGGAMENLCSDTNIINCTFYGNIAGSFGGGIYNWKGPFIGIPNYQCSDIRPYLFNCVLWNNTDCTGNNELSQIYGGNPVINYSCVYGWSGIFSGTGNIGDDPLFADPNNYDFHLKSEGWRWDSFRQRWDYDDVTSRCIDSGNPGCPLGDEPLTIPEDPNNIWGINLRIDMGAHGGTYEAGIPPHNWSLLADLNNNGIADFNDLSHQTDDWLKSGDCMNGDLDRNKIINFADIALFASAWLKETIWHQP